MNLQRNHEWIAPMPSDRASTNPDNGATVALPVLAPLAEALAQIDRVFGRDAMLRDEGRDVVATYYRVSEAGYKRVHSAKGCMHQALSQTGEFKSRDYRVQAEQVAALAVASGARRILELGSGQGFNCILLARALPDAEITGVDLMEHHVTNARTAAQGLTNVQFRRASFDALPDDLGTYDLVFSVEALCYATDLDAIARRCLALLSPRGQLVLFDAYRAVSLDQMSPDMATAVRLYEISTAVTPGFRRADDWAAALTGAGFAATEQTDLSIRTIPSVRRLHAYGHRYFSDWKVRTAARIYSELLRRNAVGALLGAYLVEGETPGRSLAAAHERGISYVRLVAHRA